MEYLSKTVEVHLLHRGEAVCHDNRRCGAGLSRIEPAAQDDTLGIELDVASCHLDLLRTGHLPSIGSLEPQCHRIPGSRPASNTPNEAKQSDHRTTRHQLLEVRVRQEQTVGDLAESVRLSIMRYRGGTTTYLEVLDGQRSLFDAELTLAQARGTEYQNLVQLYRALGGGWQQ